jgi:hypothetical protein
MAYRKSKQPNIVPFFLEYILVKTVSQTDFSLCLCEEHKDVRSVLEGMQKTVARTCTSKR